MKATDVYKFGQISDFRLSGHDFVVIMLLEYNPQGLVVVQIFNFRTRYKPPVLSLTCDFPIVVHSFIFTFTMLEFLVYFERASGLAKFKPTNQNTVTMVVKHKRMISSQFLNQAKRKFHI